MRGSLYSVAKAISFGGPNVTPPSVEITASNRSPGLELEPKFQYTMTRLPFGTNTGCDPCRFASDTFTFAMELHVAPPFALYARQIGAPSELTLLNNVNVTTIRPALAVPGNVLIAIQSLSGKTLLLGG